MHGFHENDDDLMVWEFDTNKKNKKPRIESRSFSKDNLENTIPDKAEIIKDIWPKLSTIRNKLEEGRFEENNLQQILNDLKEIQQFITKNLKEIAINFDLKKDSELHFVFPTSIQKK